MENNNLSNESVFSKGFNTLEKEGGRYYVKMQFQNQADAYAAYRVIQGLKPESPPMAPKTAMQVMQDQQEHEHQQRIRLGARQSGKSWLRQTTCLPCPNHGNSHCVQCFWPPRYEVAVFDKAILDEMISDPGPEGLAEAIHNTILYGTGAYTVQITDDRLTATAIKTGDYITDSGYDGFDNGVD